LKKTTWLGILFCALVLGYLVITSMGGGRVTCEVCMVFKDHRSCGTASANTRDNALRTAISTACSALSGGVTETNQCENTPPESVKWLH
jgi:hypothetical protein